MQPYSPGKPIGEAKRESGQTDFVKLASNENPLGPSPKAVEAMVRVASEVHRYPDASGFELKSAIAQKLSLGTDQVILGNGSDELIQMLGSLFLGSPQDAVVVGDPSFVRYDSAANLADSHLKKVPLRANFTYDLPAMLDAIDESTRVVFIANPNNPTGTIAETAELEAFLSELPDGLVTVLDEAYFEFASGDSNYPNSVDLLRKGFDVIGLRTLSKAYGLAGIRLGYGVGSPIVIDALNRVRQPFNVNHFAQSAAIAALTDDAHIKRTIEQTQRSLNRIRDAAESSGATVVPSHANFVFIDLHRPAQPVFRDLLAGGVIVRPIGGETTIRVSAGTDEETERFVAAFASAMKENVTV